MSHFFLGSVVYLYCIVAMTLSAFISIDSSSADLKSMTALLFTDKVAPSLTSNSPRIVVTPPSTSTSAPSSISIVDVSSTITVEDDFSSSSSSSNDSANRSTLFSNRSAFFVASLLAFSVLHSSPSYPSSHSHLPSASVLPVPSPFFC